MSASRLNTVGLVPEFRVETPEWRYRLPTRAVRIHRNGLEFCSPSRMPLWTEMNVSLELPGGSAPVRGTAVVVACEGSRHSGFAVSLLFLELPYPAEQELLRFAGASSG